MVAPLVLGVSSTTWKLPSAATVPEPITSPSASLIVIVEPDAPLPLTVVPSALTVSPVGASGKVTGLPTTTVPGSDSLPALSFWTTCRVAPVVLGVTSTTWKLPSAPTVPVPITSPVPSLMVIVDPGAPLPLTVVPSALTASPVGASGKVTGPPTTTVPGSDSLPALSFRTTCRVAPLVLGVTSTTWKLPSAPTVPVPIGLPLSSLMVIVEPGAPLPLTVVPSALTTNPVGASGKVTGPPTTTVPGKDSLPALSVRMTCKVAPLVLGVSSTTWKLPSAATVPEPITSPSASLIVIVEPDAPLPLTVVPSALTVSPVGASGKVTGPPTTTVPGSDSLPALSFWTTCRVAPVVLGVSSTTWKLPSAPTVPVPITSPVPSLMVIVEPGKPLPLTVVPSALTAKPVGASGKVTGPPTTTVPGSDSLPALSFWTTCRVAPVVLGVTSTTWKLPSAPTVPVPITSPVPSLIVIVEPGAPLPLTIVPSALTASPVGASGKVTGPPTTTVPGSDSLPALSFRTTCRVAPLVLGVTSTTWKLPSAPTVPVPIGLPLASLMVIVEPGAPLPLTVVPSALTTNPVGASGSGAPPATTEPGSDSLPARFVSLTNRV